MVSRRLIAWLTAVSVAGAVIVEVGHGTTWEVNTTASTYHNCRSDGRASIFYRMRDMVHFDSRHGYYNATDNTATVTFMDGVVGVLSVDGDGKKLVFTTTNYSAPGVCVRNVQVNVGSILGVNGSAPIDSFARIKLMAVDQTRSIPTCRGPDRNISIITSGSVAALETYYATQGSVSADKKSITFVDEFTHVVTLEKDATGGHMDVKVADATGAIKCVYTASVLEGRVCGLEGPQMTQQAAYHVQLRGDVRQLQPWLGTPPATTVVWGDPTAGNWNPY